MRHKNTNSPTTCRCGELDLGEFTSDPPKKAGWYWIIDPTQDEQALAPACFMRHDQPQLVESVIFRVAYPWLHRTDANDGILLPKWSELAARGLMRHVDPMVAPEV